MRPVLMSAIKIFNKNRSINWSPKVWRSTSAVDSKGGYYILAPDVPTDTVENNALLAMPTIENRVKFNEITPYKSVRAFMQRLLHFESLLDELEQGALQGDDALTLQEVIHRMDQHLVPLTFAYSAISLLTAVSSDVFKFKIMDEVTRVFDRARTRRFKITEMYTFMQKELENPIRDKNRFQKRIMEKYILEGKLNGLDRAKGEMDDINNSLLEKMKNFVENVNHSNKLVAEFIASPSTLNTLPPDFLSKNGRSWSPFDNGIYTRFMQGCNQRSVRKNFFDNYNQRAYKKGMRLNNSVNIEEIRDVRNNQANVLGYDTFANMSMETKMAGFVTNIRTMLNTLHLRTQKALEKDLKELTEFAHTSSGGEVEKLFLWDLDFYQSQYVRTTTSAATEAMQANYPLNSVLKSICSLCSRLFQIDIVESEAGVGKERFASWNPSVRLFDVFSPNGFYGSFYLDPFMRQGKDLNAFAQTHFLLSRSDAIPVKPLSALVMCLPPPLLKDQDVQLTFGDVVRLFGCFGTILQHTLTDVPCSEVNGLSNLEWDVVNMMPGFMSFWPLYDNRTINECATGSKTVVSKELQQEIADRHFKFSSISLLPELYKSALDLTLHSNTEFWQDLVYEVWDMYMKPFPLEKTDYHMCGATDIICQTPASYYSNLWSKMVAADLFDPFQANLENEEKLSELGLKLRETFLAESGANPSSEMFKAFTERNPSVEAFLRLSKSCVVYESQ